LSSRKLNVDPEAVAVPVEPREKLSGMGEEHDSPVGVGPPPDRFTVKLKLPLLAEGASTQR
jgi:hypothetical protein